MKWRREWYAYDKLGILVTITKVQITNLAINHCQFMVWTWNVEKEVLTDYKKMLKNISIILKSIAEIFLGLHNLLYNVCSKTNFNVDW